MKEKIENLIKEALKKLSIEEVDFVVEHPQDFYNGDYATNVAMVLAKKIGENPKALATRIAEQIKDEMIEEVEVAGPGFINFYLKSGVFIDELENILKLGEDYGKNKTLSGKKVMVEYTDPNPFKEFHIGHLMSNAIGESVSRLQEFSGAEVLRANYQGDVGLHIAKTIWGWKTMVDKTPSESESLDVKVGFLGLAYKLGTDAYEEQEDWKKQIVELNKIIYEKINPDIHQLYDLGRKWSLDYFETIYKKLGTEHGKDGRAFDYYFFESELADPAVKIIRSFVGKIFEESEGAVVFKGAETGDETLHTRVFINKDGLPTYEAKELALAERKFTEVNPDTSIVVTGNEIKDYYRVVMKALSLINEDWASRNIHLPHGMLRLPEGKMSSRTGNVITGESLISDVEEMARKKMSAPGGPASGWEESKKNEVATEIAVGAIKYSILKQAIGRDIIFDFDKSLSFEGDSGPYIQYTSARALSLLSKGKEQGLTPNVYSRAVGEVEKRLARFPEVALQARIDFAPQQIATYLIELSASFNSYYAQTQIIDLENKKESEYRLALTKAVSIVLKNGLWLLGIKAPVRM